MTVNKNMVVTDKNAASPHGIRLGTAALTTRGATEKTFEEIATLLLWGLDIAKEIQKTSGKKLLDFVEKIGDNSEIINLKLEVEQISGKLLPPIVC